MLFDIEVTTLNCWGLKYISQFTNQRIEHIATELANGHSDIICLQEIWQEKHWHVIRDRLKSRLPYSKFYYSGMMGSGLAILSKYPIIQTDMRPYTLNGRPQAFFRGDWFVGKGVASAIIQLPDGRVCQVFNTHMHAPYNEKVDTYLCHRIAQAWDLHKMLGASVRAGYITFATGDFNSTPGSLVHRFLTMHLADTFITLNPDLPLLPDSTLSSHDQVLTYGVTCDVSPLNTWRQTHAPGMIPKRLDYIFHDHRAVPRQHEVIFMDNVKGIDVSPSDHFGVRCSYTLAASETPVHRPLHVTDYDDIKLQLDWYTAREQKHSTLRIIHFWGSIALIFYLMSLLLSPRYPSTQLLIAICILLTSITGLLSGLIGSIWGWWELRSLTEFRDEIERAKALHKDNLESNHVS